MPTDATTHRWVPNDNIADLAGGATLADVIAKVNAILTALETAGITAS